MTTRSAAGKRQAVLVEGILQLRQRFRTHARKLRDPAVSQLRELFEGLHAGMSQHSPGGRGYATRQRCPARLCWFLRHSVCLPLGNVGLALQDDPSGHESSEGIVKGYKRP